ncbi:hypothetical protein LX64_01782 [Chitinophaga skermanii]|uniref:DUF4397 domain-containing protein n=1 Tax=Chitinophaga skermanii TaxID=331697 RepID=A0A327QRX9_9BACT|nr:hypothetical protein [Chitinophaga skermanii]RAJ06655.1 hypothetical protein LX64_01782 [Chitinophaga skermanii]
MMYITNLKRAALACCVTLIAFTSCSKTTTIDPPALAQNRVLTYKIVNVAGDPIQGIVNDRDSAITVYLPYYLQLTSIQPEITISEGASITPASGTLVEDLLKMFFSGTKIQYVVKAKDGAQRTYTLKIEAQQPPLVINELSPDANTITAYDFNMGDLYASLSITLHGSGFAASNDLIQADLLDATGKAVFKFGLSTFNTNNLTMMGINIARYNPTDYEALKALPATGLYKIRVYSYAKVVTLQHPIRLNLLNK